jgi:hypothetical protein
MNYSLAEPPAMPHVSGFGLDEKRLIEVREIIPDDERHASTTGLVPRQAVLFDQSHLHAAPGTLCSGRGPARSRSDNDVVVTIHLRNYDR